MKFFVVFFELYFELPEAFFRPVFPEKGCSKTPLIKLNPYVKTYQNYNREKDFMCFVAFSAMCCVSCSDDTEGQFIEPYREEYRNDTSKCSWSGGDLVQQNKEGKVLYKNNYICDR